jgi:phosphoribulokinase
VKHPIVVVVGSSGAGTTTVKQTFERIFRREEVTAAAIEGDAFHRYNRQEMKDEMARHKAEGDETFSHFSVEANELEELEAQFRSYGERGIAKTRHYIHNEEEAAEHGVPPGEFTPWRDIGEGSDLLFYEGLHGLVKTDEIDIAGLSDLKIGVVPVVNLEWIQKIHRDHLHRGYSAESVTDAILRRMPAYVKVICPQFTRTDINFQRVPVVDTSNPFIARWIPSAGESVVVIRFKDPRAIDFPYLLSMISGSWMSRQNSIVIPGDKLDLAMELTLPPLIDRLVGRGRRAR